MTAKAPSPTSDVTRASALDADEDFAVLGAGLVGAYLGAAGGAAVAYAGPSGVVEPRLVALPTGVRPWRPTVVREQDRRNATCPLLVSCRAHQTPWDDLPRDALVAQNGLGQPRPMIACFFALDRGDDGVVRALGPPPRIVLADPGPAWAPVIARWIASGIIVELRDDARPAQWEKAILNATVGPLCLATGLGMGAVWDDRELRELVMRATAEGGRIAAASSVAIPYGLAERAQAFFASVGGHRPSVLRDPGELPWILGHLLRQAQVLNVPCPALETIARRVEDRSPAIADPRSVVGGRG